MANFWVVQPAYLWIKNVTWFERSRYYWKDPRIRIFFRRVNHVVSTKTKHSICNIIIDTVRQSNIQLTCYSYRRNCDKPRLRCSLLNCDYTLQVLQQVAKTERSLYHANSKTWMCKCTVRIVKQQTATFQDSGSRVRTPVRYTLHTNMLHTY